MKKNGLVSRLFMLLVFLFLYAPILVLVVFSFNASKSKAVWAGFTLDWYRQLFQNDMILNALAVTLAVSALAAVISTVMGTAAAIGFRNLRRRFRSICLTVNNIPLTNADIITGVSMMLLFLLAISAWNGSLGQLTGVKWSMGFLTLLISHIAFDVPYVILSVMPKLSQLDPNIYEAAQDLGDHGFHAFYKVILPEIMPGVINGLIMAFTLSIDDFVISYFTAGSTTQTLSMVIYSMAKKRVSPEINALSTLMFLVVVALMVLVNLRQARQERMEKRRRAVLSAK
ncbi:ABC transporter permease [Intestinimonas massiliensis]|uniref:ABC transporter permease n=2 Tax=Eubacteriales incertae sedis TaxID=538999 RepID=UPI000AFD5EBA|nr:MULTISPECIES: ABC transporter permease [Intestinimonas]MCI5562902.1 ABC transporter permease [Intestinimonas massiliensis (ex Afouda et al. 2020)]MCQ4805942.1 ABC transporter permease [Intestinimonas massiliensis (ex Afouda et al. 2020)]MDY5339046.1 ABC transporter permease [Intestinimonas sp.]